jgi:hypothetical protein
LAPPDASGVRKRHPSRAAVRARRLGVGILAAACLGAAAAQAHTVLSAQTQAPTEVGANTAVLHGALVPGGDHTTYWFEVGTTTAYGIVTQPAGAGSKDKPVTVAHGIAGLSAATTYHVRLVGSHDKEVAHGADMTFTTAGDRAEDDSSPAAGSPTVPPRASTPSLPPAAMPELGHSVAVATGAGTVAVRLPGAARAVALTDTASVPVGSIVDTRHGSVDLRTALPGGASQTGTFHGGLFEVRQAPGGRGLTELVLRGALPTCAAGGARAAAPSSKRPPRSLWGHDQHGRFRTRGSNSVITVRGTTWFVSDRCDGTLTRVKSGSVSVRDLRRRRTVVVSAGHSYLAKAR